MTKSMIVAYDSNRAIGFNGDLPWGRGLPADLANFKKLTTGTSIIMGRRTFESVGSRPLPNRENIVVSSTPTGVSGVLTANSLSSAYALARYPIFIIGGGQIYSSALKDVDIIYATEVDASFEGADTFFPELDSSWVKESQTFYEQDEKNHYSFTIVKYRRETAS